jgi:hypothetical protein
MVCVLFFFSFMLSFEGKQIVGEHFSLKEFKTIIFVQISTLLLQFGIVIA